MSATSGANNRSTSSDSSTRRSSCGVRGYAAKSSFGPNCSGLTKMLTITRSASSEARPTRLPWPACKLPMVGTNATRSPLRRQPATSARSSLGRATVFMSEAVLGSWVLPRLHGLRVSLHGFERAVVPGHEVLRELRLAAGGDVENVVQHQDLPVGVRPCADADHRHTQLLGDRCTERRRNAFEQHDVRAGALERERVAGHLFGRR